MIDDEATLRQYLHPSGVVKFYRTITNTKPFPSKNSKSWSAPIDRAEVHQHGKKVDDVDTGLVRKLVNEGKLDMQPGAWLPIDPKTMELEILGTPTAASRPDGQ